MKIVLDTNVLVSGLLSPFNPPGKIVRMTSAGILELCYDARILTEYREVLERPKFSFSKDEINALVDQIEARGHQVVSKPLKVPLPDPTDEPFLEVALAGGASHLITGNQKDFPLTHEQAKFVKVISANTFVEEYRKLG